MPSVAAITGQARLVDNINRALRLTDRAAIRLRGPSGSGKTWTAQAVVELWQHSGGVAFVASGDEMFVRRRHHPLLEAVSSETGRARSKTVTRLAIEPVTAIPLGGKPLREVLLHLFEWRESDATARTPYLSHDDREVLLRMQRAASRQRPLLVCDNLQWWDEASVELLRLSFAPGTLAAFPFLENLAILALETPNDPTETPSLKGLFTSQPWQTFELALCDAASFGDLLQAFGVSSGLPATLIERLYAVTGGHLDLTRRIADAAAEFSPQRWDLAGALPEFLYGLLEQRLERHTSMPEETASALRAASVIGNTFADHEIDCLLHGRGSQQLRRLLEPAEKLRILERSGRTRAFAHDLVRAYYLGHAKTSREDLHERFAECLRLVDSGDYGRRAEHLRRSRNHRAAGEVFVLECLRAVRAGAPPALESLRARFDADLAAFVTAMYSAQIDFHVGDYTKAIDRLAGIEDLYVDSLLAERDILIARCHIKRLSREACERARALLSRWDRLRESETEVWGRAMIYRVVACVFLGDEAEARDVERRLYENLATRVAFDPTARRTVNHLRLKANMLHSVHVARERLNKAIEFFGGVGSGAEYDPVHQCIGLVNLAANHLVEGEFEQALAACYKASVVVEMEKSVTFERADILATNMTLAAFLCGRLCATEAREAARNILTSSHANNDAFLLTSNVAYYLAHETRHGEAIELLRPLFQELRTQSSLDSYYTYFVGNNLSGSLYMSGHRTDSENVWKAITPLVRDFIGPMGPYMTRRHALQSEIFSVAASLPDWDRFLATIAPLQVGPGWKFYGRGFLASELEFWSDE